MLFTSCERVRRRTGCLLTNIFVAFANFYNKAHLLQKGAQQLKILNFTTLKI